MVVLVPPSPPFPPPPRLPRIPCPLQFARFLSFYFASSPSVSFSRPPPPPPQRLIPRRLSGGLLQRNPPVDADQNKMPAPGFRRPALLMCYRPLRLVVLGLGVGWGA